MADNKLPANESVTMGKAKSKIIDKETATEKLTQRQTNVNKLIQRLNSRTDQSTDLIIREMNETTNERETNLESNNNDIGTDLVIHQNPLNRCQIECTSLSPNTVIHDSGKNVNVVVKKNDSIDNIIDLIVDKSLKREEELEKERNVKRSQSYHGKEAAQINPRRYLKLHSCHNEAKIDEEWEDTLMKRLDNLHERAKIFEKRVNDIDGWLKKDNEFERNMLNVLEKNREDGEDDLNELKTIRRTQSPVKMNDALIAAPKVDPIIRNTIDKLWHDDDDGQVGGLNCWETSSKRKWTCCSRPGFAFHFIRVRYWHLVSIFARTNALW